MKQPEVFTLKWKRQNEYYETELSKDEVFATFEGIMKGFPNNNKNAKILVKLIPIIDEIYIDFDRKTNEKKLDIIMENIIISSISIEDCHIAIWAIWNAYCMDGNLIDSVKYITLTD